METDVKEQVILLLVLTRGFWKVSEHRKEERLKESHSSTL
jgi:hypothetical protein